MQKVGNSIQFDTVLAYPYIWQTNTLFDIHCMRIYYRFSVQKKQQIVLLILIVFYYFKTELIHKMSRPGWDDDFDFEDDDAPKKKKPIQQKKANKDDDDFFDEGSNTNKLPNINNKLAPPKQAANNKRASAKSNPYTENMKLRGNVYDDDENAYQQLQDEPKIKSNQSTNKNIKNKQPQEQMDFYEDVAEVQSKKEIKQQNKKLNVKTEAVVKKAASQKSEQEEYEQQVFEDAYGDDFEQAQIEKPVSPPKKAQLKLQPEKKKSFTNANSAENNQNNLVKKAPQISNNPPKPPSRASQASKPQPSRNFTVEKRIVGKPTNLPRSQSRKSIKSVQSKRGDNSRAVSNKFATNISFLPNKFTSQIDKSFPEINLNQLNQQKLNKLNERLRAMIRKFNEELNDLINKNMLYLKSKKNQKSVNVDDKVRVLQQQCKNNDTMIQIMEKEFQKLSGRDGQLRQEQYQLLTQKKIQQAKQSIKQAQKSIQKLKTEIKSQGNKLTNKNQDKKLAAELHHLKTTLIQSKKDEEKQNEKIQKLDEQMQDLNEKITDIDYKLTQLIDLAKQKGIKLESKDQLIKKFETTKKKVQASQNHRAKLQNLLKTKSDIISHEKEQLRINIKNCELEIKNLYDSIGHAHNQSVKVVEKAKTNPKLNQNLLADLDSILKSLELVQPDNYSVRSEQNKSQVSQRPLKNSVIGNMEKSQPHKRSESANNEKHINVPAFQDNSKPNLLKKKPKVNDMPEEKKNDERIWREQQKLEQSKSKPTQKAKQVQKPPEQQKDKKKPFTLKKNRIGEGKPNEDKTEIQEPKQEAFKLDSHQNDNKKQEQEKKEQISLAGPRMMKFKRRANDQLANQIPKQQEKPAEQKPIAQETPKQEQDKPVYAPKRFMLRNRQDKKQDSYIPTTQVKEKEEIKKQTPAIQKAPQQYKPKFNFGDVEDNFKKPANPAPQQKQTEKISIPSLEQKKQQEDSKPRFNLRLRDRKKNTEQIGGQYVPTTNQVKPAQQKPTLNMNQVPKSNTLSIKQNSNNPYAPKENTLNLASKRSQNSNNNNSNLNSMNNINTSKAEQKIVPAEPQTKPSNPNNPYTQNQAGNGGRSKEGPVKKPKVQPGQKQKFNIYEQAEQAEGLNQFVNEAPKKQVEAPSYNPYAPSKEKDLNLNDLLGVNNKKKDDDLADLIGGGGGNKKAKKNNDFFGDIDL